MTLDMKAVDSEIEYKLQGTPLVGVPAINTLIVTKLAIAIFGTIKVLATVVYHMRGIPIFFEKKYTKKTKKKEGIFYEVFTNCTRITRKARK